MIKVENIKTYNIARAIYSARNAYNSWDKSDSDLENDIVGENDLELAKKLYKAGSSHRKYLRQCFVTMDVTAPLFWWREMDTYKIGTTANSTSFMHTGMSKEFKLKDFDIEFKTTNSELFHEVPIEIDIENEVWKTIPNFENYEVSNTSKVRSKDKQIVDSIGVIRHYKGHEIIQCVNSSNYKKVLLRKRENNQVKSYNKYVHRLVAESFIPNPFNCTEVNHIDGNKLNNNISNLEWVSKAKNSQHAFENNLRIISEYNKYKVSNSEKNFSQTDIITIYKLFELGKQKKEIAEIFGCCSSRICDLLNDKEYQSRNIDKDFTYADTVKIIIDELNTLRQLYFEENDNEEKQKIWRQIIHILPQGYLYRRTLTMNYENAVNIIQQRSGHRLTEWKDFTEILRKLPYLEEIMA